MQGAWKVGLLVVVFVGLVLGGYAFLGSSVFKPKAQVYFAELSDAGGVAPGTRLLMAGVQVGTISKVELKDVKTARLTLEIERGVRVPRGTSLVIPASLLSLGESPMTLAPGPGPDDLPPGSTMSGKKPSMLESSLPEVNKTLDGLNATMMDLRKVMASVNSVISDDQRLAKVDHLLTTIDGTVSKFGQVAGRIDGLLSNNQNKLASALGSFQHAMKDVQQTTSMVASMVKDGQYQDKVNAILVNLDKTTEKASGLVDELKAFVTDPNLRDPLDKTVKNVATLSDSGTRIAANAEKIADNGVKISEKVSTFADKANELADSAKDALEQLKKMLGRTPSTNRLNLTTNLDLLRESRPTHYRTDLEVGFTIGQNRVHAGLFDAFESNKITLQVGQGFAGSKGEIRYGIYASKPGLGVEYEIARGMSIRGDLFDINTPRLDLRARINLGGGFYGWLGGQQLFKRNALTVGVGFRK